MLKRVLTLMSVSLTLIILVFIAALFNLVYQKGVLTDSVTGKFSFDALPLFPALVIFVLLAFVGAILTGLAYSKEKKIYLVVGTLVLLVSSVPNVVMSISLNNRNPYILSALILAPIIINLINMYTFDSRLTNVDGVGKSILSKRKK